MRFLTLVFLVFVSNVRAEEFAIHGGTSPNGRYSILLVRDAKPPDPGSGQANYKVVFRNNGTQTTQPLETGPQTFFSFEGAQEPVNSQAWWSPDGGLFALCFRTTRHSREPYLYSVSRGIIHRVPLPDYDAVIYGRLGVEPVGEHYVRCPTEWLDSHTLKLLAWGDMNECHITLHIQKRGTRVPKVSIVRVAKGKPLEG